MLLGGRIEGCTELILWDHRRVLWAGWQTTPSSCRQKGQRIRKVKGWIKERCLRCRKGNVGRAAREGYIPGKTRLNMWLFCMPFEASAQPQPQSQQRKSIRIIKVWNFELLMFLETPILSLRGPGILVFGDCGSLNRDRSKLHTHYHVSGSYYHHVHCSLNFQSFIVQTDPRSLDAPYHITSTFALNDLCEEMTRRSRGGQFKT